MPLAYLIDEHLRGALKVSILSVATRLGLQVDVIQVGDDFGPPLGTKDPELLLWAETEDRLLISHDTKSMDKYFRDHLDSGHNSPGILRPRARPLIELAEHLVLLAYATDRDEWRNFISYIPQ